MSNGQVEAAAYTPTNWQDGVTPLNAANFNKIEAELASLEAAKVPPVVNGQWIKGVGGAMVWSAIAAGDLPDLSATYQAVSGKAAANGYASLDAGTRVPFAQLPVLSGSDTQPVSAANTDISWVYGNRLLSYYQISTGGGSLRSIGAPGAGDGAIIVVRN